MKKFVMVTILVAIGIVFFQLASVGAWPFKAKKGVNFEKHERTVFSQGGEDGVIEKIFEIIEPTSHFAIEFGGADGIEDSNIRNLILHHNWSGLFIEGVESLARKAEENYKDMPRVKTLHAWVYPGNVEILFEENNVPRDVDFLVIDIDSNDYYVWRAIRDFRPKVVQIEVNGVFAPPQRAVVEFDPFNYWDGSDYYGASIQSYYELGKKKGYELIYCVKHGGNLFFVDEKYFERFGIQDNSPAKLYRSPRYGVKRGSRAPNGRGWLPNGKDLVYKAGRIKKKFVER